MTDVVITFSPSILYKFNSQVVNDEPSFILIFSNVIKGLGEIVMDFSSLPVLIVAIPVGHIERATLADVSAEHMPVIITL